MLPHDLNFHLHAYPFLLPQSIDRISTEAHRLFEDVESDFCELGAIKRHFERWRNEQGESYHEAYIALCLPKLFTPFVKLKLLDWNPLEVGVQSFDRKAP